MNFMSMMNPFIGQGVLADVSGLIGFDGVLDEIAREIGTIVDIGEIGGHLTVILDHCARGVNWSTLRVPDVTALF